MDKKIIIILSIILFSLIGIIFIISSIISGNSSNGSLPDSENNIGQEEVPSAEDINTELSNIRNIIENTKTNKGGYEYLYDEQEFLNSVTKLKTLGGTNIISNINPQNQTYCLSLLNNGINLCIDNNFIGSVAISNCNRNNTTCAIIGIEERESGESEVILEEEKEEVVAIEEPKTTLEEEVKVGNTTISKYKNENGQEIIFVNEKEYGPYIESYIVYDESEWGILMNYNNKWYVNINGKATGPYLEKPTVEFYEDNLGFSYLKDDNYYVNLKNEIYGPYSDLTEFDLDNNN